MLANASLIPAVTPGLAASRAATEYLVPVYLAYAVAAAALTVWLARTLFRSGAVFLEDIFEKPELANAVNRLLVTGFYMINLGYAAFLLKADAVSTSTGAIEVLAKKLGVLLLSLAVVHFVNVAVFYRMRRRHELRHMPPPVSPQRTVTPPPAPHAPTAPDAATPKTPSFA